MWTEEPEACGKAVLEFLQQREVTCLVNRDLVIWKVATI